MLNWTTWASHASCWTTTDRQNHRVTLRVVHPNPRQVGVKDQIGRTRGLKTCRALETRWQFAHQLWMIAGRSVERSASDTLAAERVTYYDYRRRDITTFVSGHPFIILSIPAQPAVARLIC